MRYVTYWFSTGYVLRRKAASSGCEAALCSGQKAENSVLKGLYSVEKHPVVACYFRIMW